MMHRCQSCRKNLVFFLKLTQVVCLGALCVGNVNGFQDGGILISIFSPTVSAKYTFENKLSCTMKIYRYFITFSKRKLVILRHIVFFKTHYFLQNIIVGALLLN